MTEVSGETVDTPSPDTTLYVGVDLASRYSAAVALNSSFEVIAEAVGDFGPATKPPNPYVHFEFIKEFDRQLHLMTQGLSSVDVIYVEDVYPHAINAKPAMRAQGILLYNLWLRGAPEAKLVLPLAWQRFFGYKKITGRTSKKWAKDLCLEFGYNPKNKGKTDVDLRDAYLIARYAVEMEK